MDFIEKKIFTKIRPLLPLSPFTQRFSAVLPLSHVFAKSFFSTKFTLLDAVLCADSKYHMHFTQNSIFLGHNEEILAHFVGFSAMIRVFLLFEYVVHLFSYFRSHIRKEHEKLHRTIYVTRWIKISFAYHMELTLPKTWFFVALSSI